MAATETQSLDVNQWFNTKTGTSVQASMEKSPPMAYLTALEYQPTASTTETRLPWNLVPSSDAAGASFPAYYPPGETLGYVMAPALAQASGQHLFSDFSGQGCPIGSSLATSADIIGDRQVGLLPSGHHITMEGSSESLTSSAVTAAHEPYRSSKRRGGPTRATFLQVCAAYVVLLFLGVVVLVLLIAAGVWPRRQQAITTTTLRIETLRNRYEFFDPSITVSPANDYNRASRVETITRTPVGRALFELTNSTELLYDN
ncbi:uncharacterized protein [Dermacentor andersoni]|uniref:uncharacterized protein n=1 Tax=Dermacentor andersoni TaxID=34620 RepID=UPI002416A693|nr:uncharacterized protein LOC129382960 [Dermacentor andersoni]